MWSYRKHIILWAAAFFKRSGNGCAITRNQPTQCALSLKNGVRNASDGGNIRQIYLANETRK